MRIYELFSTIRRNPLVENTVSLFFLQAANYLFPILVIPLMVRALGIEKFGLLSFSQAFLHYFIVLIEYGFNLTASRQISLHRDQPAECQKIFAAVMVTKGLLLFLSA
ncbi:MAG: oligosaccharide flippase family protein, partial [Rhizobacter sp.]|nr:oligosaccharide flippase family protein [Chlorobiales bacterium]